MIDKINETKIEIIIITVIDPMGEVEGEVIPNDGSRQSDKPTKIKFNDQPPVSVGDKVLVRIINEENLDTNETTKIGKYIRKISSTPEKIIGILKSGFDGEKLVPTEKKNRAHYKVEKNTINALDGELVEAQICKDGKNRISRSVKIIRKLGNSEQVQLASTIAIQEHGIPDHFSDQIYKDALQRAKLVIENPTDLTHLPFISIDPSNARDHDDAIYVLNDPDNQGGFIIWVAIADVAKYVLQGSELDAEALKRGNSTYFPDLVIPMLPDVLSGNICSLKAGQVRAAIAVKIWINKVGKKTRHSFFRCTIKNEMACSYEEVQGALDDLETCKRNTTLKKLLEPIHAAYQLLARQTQSRGPLELELIEQEILFDKAGAIKTIKSKERLEAHRIVEEFMIVANICAAETIQKHKLPFLYRIHEPPTFEKLLNLRTSAKSLDVNLSNDAKLTGHDLNKLLEKAKQTNCEELISLTILRAMSQAYYSPENRGHFGLNLRYYTHFTSPIRRYSDVLVHRALIHIHNWDQDLMQTDESELFKIGDQISKTERRSMLAERDTKDRYLAYFLKDRIDSEFSARINGFSKSCIFVRLDETGANGLIPLSFLSNDRYRLNNEKNRLIARSSKLTFNVGAEVLVKLKEANPISGGLIFTLIEYKNKAIPVSKKFTRRKKNLKRKNLG